MRLLIRGCGEVGGEIAPAPSLWSSITTLLAAAALGGAEVVEIDTLNQCISNVLRLLRLLGYNVDKISTTRLIIRGEEELTRPLIARLNLDCGLLVAGPLSVFFALNAPPGSRLILSARGSEYILSIEPRELKELLSMIGARVWSTHSVSQYLVIEKRAAPIPRVLRVTTPNAALIASLLVALPGPMPSRPPLVRLIAPQLYARERLRYVETLLASTGLDVSIGSESIRLERTSTKSNRLKPLPGVAETLTILSYAAPCDVSKIVIKTAALSNDQLQELQYLVKLIGYDAEAYSDRLELSKSSPKTIVYNTEQVPELAIPLIINAFRVGGSAVSGLRPSISEGLVSRHIESVGKTFGAEAYLEEDERLRILKPLEKGGESTMSCRGLDPASCSLVVYGVLAGRRRAVVDQAGKAINVIPFGLEYLQMLGIDISV